MIEEEKGRERERLSECVKERGESECACERERE